jgi:uncharacterized RDD family membrane protein YckC
VTCPSCRRPVPLGQAHCPSCGATVAPPTEGALAPDAGSLNPSPHAKTEPLREIPALRKRERTWKDEVKERVRHRRKTRSGPDGTLPLFEAQEPEVEPELKPTVEISEVREPPALHDDLPLHGRAVESEPEEAYIDSPIPVDEPPEAEEEQQEDFPLNLPPREAESRPVERPAHLSERVIAAALDLLCLGALWATTLYFAGRVSHVGLLGLRPAWPYVLGYLGFVGLYYAAYFTGTTGQTIGKIACGLRVVNTAGQPPGYLRALFRAIAGVLGIALLFLGVIPLFFDPARRAFHDRLFRTRVVKG